MRVRRLPPTCRCAFTLNRMLASELDFELPPELIAQSPTDRRDRSRLLVYRRKERKLSHHYFHDLPDLLPPCLRIFRNDVSVLKARLSGKRPTGGSVECLLLRPEGTLENTWRCLLKTGGKTARTGKFFLPDEYEATVLESLPSGEYLVKFDLRRMTTRRVSPNELGFSPCPLTCNARPMTGTNSGTRPFMPIPKTARPWPPPPQACISHPRFSIYWKKTVTPFMT